MTRAGSSSFCRHTVTAVSFIPEECVGLPWGPVTLEGEGARREDQRQGGKAPSAPGAASEPVLMVSLTDRHGVQTEGQLSNNRDSCRKEDQCWLLQISKASVPVFHNGF